MIVAKIDVTKIAKEHLFKGAKGTYLDIRLVENKDGEDKYGNAGFVAQEVSREKREAGERGPIIGNYKVFGKREDKPAPKKDDHIMWVDKPEDETDDIPF